MRFHSAHSLGFTLIELLVTITLIASLSLVILPRVANFNSDNNLRIAATGMVSAIRAAQAEAIAGDRCGTQLNPSIMAFNWNFGFEYSNSQVYYYEAYCIDSSGNDIALPQYQFNYPTGVTAYQIWAYPYIG